jgi:hypothetical protein
VALLYGLYVVIRLGVHGWDASFFITAGDEFVEAEKTPTRIFVQPGSRGYDGQFYYRLALEPVPTEQTRYGVTISRPAYRSQRILYPLTARFLALGNASLIPLALIIVNLLSIAAIGYLGALVSKEHGSSSLFGLTVGLYPGLLLSLSRDLTEPLALALMLGSLVLLRRSRPAPASIALGLAILARETALLLAIVAGTVWLLAKISGRLQRRGSEIPWLYFTVPGLVFVGWQFVLWRIWGELPVLAGSGTPRSLPLAGIREGFMLASAKGSGLPWVWMMEAAFLLGLWAAALILVRQSDAKPLEKAAFVAYGALGLVLSGSLWEEDWGFLRIGADAALLAGIVVLASRSRLKPAILAATCVLWAALAAVNISN